MPLIFVLFLGYMPLITLAVTALDCYGTPVDGVRYLRTDLAVACGRDEHAVVQAGAWVLLLVVGLGFPLAVLGVLSRHGRVPSLRFLSDGYAPQFKWWESVVLVRKAALVMAASLATDAVSQVSLAVGAVLLCVWLQGRSRPYASAMFNGLEMLSLMALGGTATVSLLWLRAVPPDASSVSEVLDGLVTALLIGGNVIVVGLLLLGVARRSKALEAVLNRIGVCRGA